ncbi:methylenetetrahydrofolate reductase [Halomonas sp. EGI 63088]|uniref:Methylenetetrahydrofolate reductase n=1 Tax=Halomonas flagellata TaxID=2920385 RepID=A0ABS9RNQ9_9GAMM|nr:methylenetetrahydrofolate reductase [Halomonas flagellata]MCH4561602.1 methylenetetrahydrofolate reductase [Halomonas flagellata]
MNDLMRLTTAEEIGRSCAALAAPRYELLPLKGMQEAARSLPPGAVVTMTCSPRHGLERTLEAAEWLVGAGFQAVPHIAARLVRDPAHLRRLVERMLAAGIDDCFVVGGDADRPAGEYPGGVELLEAMAAMSPRPARLGVPAYPEGHHRFDDPDLQRVLDAKAALADYVVTQMCFEPSTVLAWLERQRRSGMTLPVYAGIPGVLDRTRLLSVAMRLGLGASTRVLSRRKGLVGRLLQSDLYRPDDLLQGLFPALGDGGIAGLHVYTFNQAAATRAWLAAHHAAHCRRHGLEGPEMSEAATVEQPG